MKIQKRAGALMTLGVVLIAKSAVAQDDALILTAVPPLYSITATLAEGTSISIRNMPATARRMNALPRWFEKPSEESVQLLRKADAVVTMGKLWREDPLYAAAREHNIRVVNIDATEPYSATLPGVARVRAAGTQAPWERSQAAPTDQQVSIPVWLSLSNGARMADIIARDLIQLSPNDADRIVSNLTTFRRVLFELKSEYESKLGELADLSLFSLSSDFTYLTGDLGLFVDGYFVKQDIDWTAEDLRHLSDYLRQRRIRLVIHKWEPSAAIKEAISAAGAFLIVLTTAEDGVIRDGALSRDGYLAELRRNLESIYQAGKAADGTRGQN